MRVIVSFAVACVLLGSLAVVQYGDPSPELVAMHRAHFVSLGQ